MENAHNTLPLINERLRTRNEFVRGSPRLVELEQRYCFLFTSVNLNELSLLSMGKGKTKQNPTQQKTRLSSFFFFFNKLIYFYLFTFGWVGSLLLRAGSL